MIRISQALLAAILVFPGSAQAQTTAPPAGAAPGSDASKSAAQAGPPSRRYRFSHVEDGVLRLDNETGQVMLCKAQAGAWACKELPEQRVALDAEIDRLKAQNQALQSQIEAMQKVVISADERAVLSEKIVSLRGENDALKSQTEATQKLMISADERAVLSEKIVSLKAENDALKRQNESAKNQVTVLETLMGAQSEREAQKAEIAGLKSANDILTSQLASLQTQIEALQKQIAELTARRTPEGVPPAKQSDARQPLREDLERARHHGRSLAAHGRDDHQSAKGHDAEELSELRNVPAAAVVRLSPISRSVADTLFVFAIVGQFVGVVLDLLLVIFVLVVVVIIVGEVVVLVLVGQLEFEGRVAGDTY